MKPMKSTLVLILSFFFISNLNAQVIDLRGATRGVNLLDEKNNLQYSDVKGSPYQEEDFIQGNVILNSGKTMENVMLRYNYYTNNFEFKEDGQIMMFTNETDANKVKYQGKTFVYGEYKNLKGERKSAYFKELVKGNCSLYKLKKIVFKDEHHPEDPMDTYKPKRFEEESPEYFLQFSGEKMLTKINTFRKKKFVESFNQHQRKLLRYLKKNRFNMRNEEELIKTINYYNSIESK